MSADKDSPSHSQFIYLIRYGLTDPPLIEGVGNYDSDIHGRIGVKHANCIAEFLMELPEDRRPSIVFADPFLRCAHTGSIIAEKLQHLLKIEEGVTEWMVPNLLVDGEGKMTQPSSVEELKKKFPETIDASYQSVHPVVYDTESGKPTWFPESEAELYKRVGVTLDRILQNTSQNIAIVSHAPCLQAMAVVLEGCADNPTATKIVKPWNLGGITCFSREKGNAFTCEYFSSTSHMPEGEYREGSIGAWSLETFASNA